MSLKELITRGPRNIRKKLFRDIIAIVLVTATAILAITYYQGRTIKHEISAQLIKESSQLIQERFLNYLLPFDNSLHLLARLVESALGDASQPQQFDTILIPILDVYNDIKHITMIDESGDSYRVVRTVSGYQSTFVPHSKSNSLLSAEFYKGAFLAPDKDIAFWHETFTSNYEASGLFASIRTKPAQLDKIYVIVLFIPAKNIISFISDIETPENVDIILYNDQGMLLSQKQLQEILESSTSNEIAGNNILTSPESIRALELWQGGDEKATTVLNYRVGGIRWWAGFSPLNKDTSNSWISIIVPETALLEDVTKRWLQLGIFAPVILIIAIIMTINLVRRYSYQLKNLPHQNFINVNLQENVKKLIEAGESSSVEFKSTMRNNLKSGKHGKEIEIAWLKGISAFMNSDGGIILIGVNDDGEIVGIDGDDFANDDKCRLHFKNLINSHIGTDFVRYIHLSFCQFDTKTVLVIECEHVRRPVFLTVGKTESFYVRSGPSSMKLSMSQMIKYLSEH